MHGGLLLWRASPWYEHRTPEWVPVGGTNIKRRAQEGKQPEEVWGVYPAYPTNLKGHRLFFSCQCGLRLPQRAAWTLKCLNSPSKSCTTWFGGEKKTMFDLRDVTHNEDPKCKNKKCQKNILIQWQNCCCCWVLECMVLIRSLVLMLTCFQFMQNESIDWLGKFVSLIIRFLEP